MIRDTTIYYKYLAIKWLKIGALLCGLGAIGYSLYNYDVAIYYGC